MNGSDVIAAISTPPGQSGIGIVRASGKGSIEVAEKITKLSCNKKASSLETSKLYHGFVVDKNKNTVDEVLVSVTRAPKTYTTEDTVEINCHGGPITLRKTLQLLINNGARLAEPGEFTKRAFLGGRIDLTQAEAVVEVIEAKSKEALRAATNQITGRLSEEINNIRKEIIEALANIEVAVDFSDEEPETLEIKQINNHIKIINKDLKKLIYTYEEGRILKEGILTVIVGPPNAGKSSLLNTLLKHEKAIVTEVPGTTRDLIEETINIKGVPVIIRDTAGLRKPKNKVEKIGVERAHESILQADLVILVLDGSRGNKREIQKMLNALKDTKTIVAINKQDLTQKISASEVKELMPSASSIIKISAMLDKNIDKLEKAINRTVYRKKIAAKDVIITNVRHVQLLKEAEKAIKEFKKVSKNEPEEVLALLLREALSALDKITGRSFETDLIDTIFEQFCIGK